MIRQIRRAKRLLWLLVPLTLLAALTAFWGCGGGDTLDTIPSQNTGEESAEPLDWDNVIPAQKTAGADEGYTSVTQLYVYESYQNDNGFVGAAGYGAYYSDFCLCIPKFCLDLLGTKIEGCVEFKVEQTIPNDYAVVQDCNPSCDTTEWNIYNKWVGGMAGTFWSDGTGVDMELGRGIRRDYDFGDKTAPSPAVHNLKCKYWDPNNFKKKKGLPDKYLLDYFFTTLDGNVYYLYAPIEPLEKLLPIMLRHKYSNGMFPSGEFKPSIKLADASHHYYRHGLLKDQYTNQFRALLVYQTANDGTSLGYIEGTTGDIIGLVNPDPGGTPVGLSVNWDSLGDNRSGYPEMMIAYKSDTLMFRYFTGTNGTPSETWITLSDSPGTFHGMEVDWANGKMLIVNNPNNGSLRKMDGPFKDDSKWVTLNGSLSFPEGWEGGASDFEAHFDQTSGKWMAVCHSNITDTGSVSTCKQSGMVGYCISNERAIYFFLEGTGWKTLHKDDYDVFVEFMEYAFIKDLLEEANLMPYHELIVTRWPDAASNESPSVLSFMSQPKYDFWPHAYPNGRKSFVSFYDGDPANPGAPQYYPLWNSAYDKRDSGEVTDLEFYPGSGQTIGHAFVGLGDGEVKMLTLEQGTE